MGSPVLPVDDSLGMPDDEDLTGLCDLTGSLLRPPRCHDDEKAMIVLRRPGSPEISEADAHIFAQVRKAAAPPGDPHPGNSTWRDRPEHGR